jgi:uncharacterized protein (TIGR02145 family)
MKKINRIWTFLIVLLGIVTLLTTGCKKTNNSIPVLTTSDISQITQSTASGGGDISSDGGSSVTARGVCWDVNSSPTISNSKTADGTGMGNFSSTISGLSPNTTNYVRAYATNSVGTAYGNEVSFKTPQAETIVSDPDGNVYHSVTIGTQVWMTENLRTTKYANGATIPTTNPATLDISSETSPIYQWAPNGDENLAAIYGRYYTGFVAMLNVCPTGWHVPTNGEWSILSNSLGGDLVSGGTLKESGTVHWISPNFNATNSSGFNALPGGGGRDPHGTFDSFGLSVVYWSSSPNSDATGIWDLGLATSDAAVHRDATPGTVAFFIRCIQNN